MQARHRRWQRRQGQRHVGFGASQSPRSSGLRFNNAATVDQCEGAADRFKTGRAVTAGAAQMSLRSPPAAPAGSGGTAAAGPEVADAIVVVGAAVNAPGVAIGPVRPSVHSPVGPVSAGLRRTELSSPRSVACGAIGTIVKIAAANSGAMID